MLKLGSGHIGRIAGDVDDDRVSRNCSFWLMNSPLSVVLCMVTPGVPKRSAAAMLTLQSNIHWYPVYVNPLFGSRWGEFYQQFKQIMG